MFSHRKGISVACHSLRFNCECHQSNRVRDFQFVANDSVTGVRELRHAMFLSLRK